jgi:uncharacterized protein YggE
MPQFNPAYRAAGIGVAAAALLVGAFTIGLSQGAGSTAQAATATGQQQGAPSGAGRITVTGTGTVTGTPNQLVLSMGVQVNGGSVSGALAQANQATDRVTAALKGLGVSSGDIQTAGLSIYPSYSDRSQVPTGYQVTESLTATLRQLDKAGQQIQAAADAGGNAITVSNVSLNLTDDGPLLAVARANAMKDARAKADQFARAAGEQLGQIISITPVGSSGPPVFNPMASASAGSAAVPISPGSQQVSVSVTVVYAV